jgi:hypothetical protein
MKTDKNEDLQNGINNEENPFTPINGGDDEVGLPSIQEKKSYINEKDNEPNNEEIPSSNAEIENPHIKSIIKKIVDDKEGGDKVDIDFPKQVSFNTTNLPPTAEYLEN